MYLPLLVLYLYAAATAPAEAPLAAPPHHQMVDVRDLINAAGSQEDNDGADAVLVLDETRVDVEESGLAHYRQRRVFKVLAATGAVRLTSQRFDYDPSSNVIEIKHARIHPKRQGKDVPKSIDIAAKNIRDLPQPQHWIYWGPRMKVLSVPRLEVGDALEIETYKKGFIIAYLGDGQTGSTAKSHSDDESRFVPPMRGHFYDVVLFGNQSMPVLMQRYEVSLPRDKTLQFEVYNGEVFSSSLLDGNKTRYSFWKAKLAAQQAEPHASDAGDYVPKVVMATVPDWQSKSQWFYDVNEKQFASNPDIDAKVAEITKNASNDDAKVDAILHWTAQNIRYSGISMGRGEGYTLHSGAMTFRDKAGVCKDIAGMSITMLRAAGMTAYPAMTMAGARVERVPADQFNHCVVAVKRPEGYRLIDPTWAPFSSELWSSAEREQHYVIGSPQGETLMKTPYLPPDHNTLEIKARSRIELSGELVSDVRISAHGYPEDRLRRLIARNSVEALHSVLLSTLQRAALGVELEMLRFTDHRDLKTPLIIELRYHIANYANIGAKVMRTQIPTSSHLLGSSNFADWLSSTTQATRHSAIWLRSPQLVQFSETIDLPRGFHLRGAAIEEKSTTAVGEFEAKLHQEGKQLVFSETIRIAQRNIAIDQYTHLKSIADSVRAFSGRSFYLSTQGGQQ